MTACHRTRTGNRKRRHSFRPKPFSVRRSSLVDRAAAHGMTLPAGYASRPAFASGLSAFAVAIAASMRLRAARGR